MLQFFETLVIACIENRMKKKKKKKNWNNGSEPA